ncbi:copper amine oxidase, partial [Vibrio xuii]
MNKTILSLATFMLLSGPAVAADVLNHKSPYCGCCTEWTKHMQEAGFNVQ